MTNRICPNSMGEAACRAFRASSRILFVQRQLRLNRRQPKRLHLGVQWEAFPQVLCQGFGSCRIARHGKRKRGFDLDALTRGSKLQSLCRCLPRFRSIAVSGFSQSSIRLPDCPIFLAVRPDGGVHSPLGQFPRLAQMTAIRLGVGCQRKSTVLVSGLPANHCCCSAIAAESAPRKARA